MTFRPPPGLSAAETAPPSQAPAGQSPRLSGSQKEGRAHRQRDIFPLPFLGAHDFCPGRRLCHGTRQRVRRRLHWQAWADRGIASLNALGGRGQSCHGGPSQVQERCLANIVDAYKAVGPPPANFCGKEALRELLANSSVYSESRTDVRPYAKHLVAFPSVAETVVNLGDCLGEADRTWLKDWRLHMLRPPEESAALRRDCDVRRPYADPSLVQRPQVYADFLHTLYDRNMLRWKLANGQQETIAPFFVGKKGHCYQGGAPADYLRHAARQPLLWRPAFHPPRLGWCRQPHRVRWR